MLEDTNLDKHKTVIMCIFNDVFNKHQLDLVPKCYTEDCAGWDPANNAELRGHEWLIGLIRAYRAAFPEHYYVPHQVFGEGNMVCTRWTVIIPAAQFGKEVSFDGLSVCEFSAGKVCRVWQHWDNLGFLQQLGEVSTDVSVQSAVRNLALAG